MGDRSWFLLENYEDFVNWAKGSYSTPSLPLYEFSRCWLWLVVVAVIVVLLQGCAAATGGPRTIHQGGRAGRPVRASKECQLDSAALPSSVALTTPPPLLAFPCILSHLTFSPPPSPFHRCSELLAVLRLPLLHHSSLSLHFSVFSLFPFFLSFILYLILSSFLFIFFATNFLPRISGSNESSPLRLKGESGLI